MIILTLCAIAAAQSRRSLAVLPAVAENSALDPQGLILLTDKVRELASKNLPMDRFLLLKQDAIVNRIGAEELFRACKEGVCVAELTRMVDADYGARCDIFKRDNSLLLKFELYSVNEESIVETFTEYDVEDFNAMRALLDARLPDAFKKMADALKAAQDAADRSKEQAAPASAPKPKTGMSFGAGVFFAGDFGGGVVWGNDEVMAMPYSGGGAYLFFDAVYTEAFAGVSVGGGKWESNNVADKNRLPDMSRVCLNFGVFAKYPFDVGGVKLFPLLGIDYEASVSGKVTAANGTEYPFDGTGGFPVKAGELSALWVKFGGGVDVGLSDVVYLRAELLYGLRTANTFEQNSTTYRNDADGKPRQGNGLTVKAGAGVNF